jgi:hypothetical protein
VSTKIQERVLKLSERVSILLEMGVRPDLPWVVLPAIVLFPKGSAGPFFDATLAWLRFGITLRIE